MNAEELLVQKEGAGDLRVRETLSKVRWRLFLVESSLG